MYCTMYLKASLYTSICSSELVIHKCIALMSIEEEREDSYRGRTKCITTNSSCGDQRFKLFIVFQVFDERKHTFIVFFSNSEIHTLTYILINTTKRTSVKHVLLYVIDSTLLYPVNMSSVSVR